jgi:hypothetical protein
MILLVEYFSQIELSFEFSYVTVLISLLQYTGPDAVEFIVNHASVQSIFCVPQTLSIVSLTNMVLLSRIIYSLLF